MVCCVLAAPLQAQDPTLRIVTRSSVTVLAGKALDVAVSPVATVTFYATDSLSRMRVLPGETAPRHEQLWVDRHRGVLVVAPDASMDSPAIEIAPRAVRASSRYRIESMTSETRDLGAGPAVAGVATRTVERTISTVISLMMNGDTVRMDVSLTRRGAVAPSLVRADPYMLASGSTRMGAAAITVLVGALADSAERAPGTVRGPLLLGTQTLRVRGQHRGRSRPTTISYDAVDSVRVDTITTNTDVAASVRLPGPRSTLVDVINGLRPIGGSPGGQRRKDPVRGGPVCHD